MGKKSKKKPVLQTQFDRKISKISRTERVIFKCSCKCRLQWRRFPWVKKTKTTIMHDKKSQKRRQYYMRNLTKNFKNFTPRNRKFKI